MPVDRSHAFARGPLRLVPVGNFGLVRRLLARAAATWLDVGERVALEAAAASFQRGSVHGEGLHLGPRAFCVNLAGRERVVLGKDVMCRGVLRVEPSGSLRVGDGVYIGDDVVISAMDSIEIGAETMLAHGVQIFDNDSHPVDPEARRAERVELFTRGKRMVEAIGRAPVTIGPGAWIGMGSSIMKGVRVGAGSIVAAGSVVVHDVPPGCLAGGNPARVLKRIGAGDP